MAMPQSPFKPCRRHWGRKQCGGKFIPVETNGDETVYTCMTCERIIKSKLIKPTKKKIIKAETTLIPSESEVVTN